MTVDPEGGGSVTVGIERLHLEQDAAARASTIALPANSYVALQSLRRCLMEIVSKPDLRSADEAKASSRSFVQSLRYLGTLRRRYGKGSLRADVISGAPPGRTARHALRNQERQLDPLYRTGGRTRGAPADRDHRGRRVDRSGNASVRSTRGETRSMRSSKKRHDYRYFPIPTCCLCNSTRLTSRN